LDNLYSIIKDKRQVIKNPKQTINDLNIRLDDKLQLIDLNIKNLICLYSERINSITRIIENLSFKNVLKRGFSIIWNSDHVISSTEQLDTVNEFDIEFANGKTRIERRNCITSKKKDSINKKYIKNKFQQKDLFDLN